jgi:ATP-dependent Clp endopeptidase proteolytic subunit ClpP
MNVITINLIIYSVCGFLYDMFVIIFYIVSLDVKVNTICRGCAMSAAAIILTCGTGVRMMSRRSTVMFHQVSSFLEGKVSDIKANFDNMKNLERNVYDLLAERTNKDANWWQENMRTDLFLSPDQLKEFGVIDEII